MAQIKLVRLGGDINSEHLVKLDSAQGVIQTQDKHGRHGGIMLKTILHHEVSSTTFSRTRGKPQN